MEEENDKEVPDAVDQDSEEDETPEFVCGVTLLQLPDGQGIRLQPLEGKSFARMATLTDLHIMGAQLLNHMETMNTVDKVLTALDNANRRRKGLVH